MIVVFFVNSFSGIALAVNLNEQDKSSVAYYMDGDVVVERILLFGKW